jgi:hypothetical protein
MPTKIINRHIRLVLNKQNEVYYLVSFDDMRVLEPYRKISIEETKSQSYKGYTSIL